MYGLEVLGLGALCHLGFKGWVRTNSPSVGVLLDLNNVCPHIP